MGEGFSCSRLENGAGFDDEEKGTETHGAEVPREEGFAPGADVGNEGFESEDDGDAPEAEDEDEQAG